MSAETNIVYIPTIFVHSPGVKQYVVSVKLRASQVSCVASVVKSHYTQKFHWPHEVAARYSMVISSMMGYYKM